MRTRLLLVAGLVLACLAISAGAPMQSLSERALLGNWLTVAAWPIRALPVNPHVVLVAAIAGLVAVWIAIALSLHRGGSLPRFAFAAWVAPFAIAPPFLSRDAFAYLAQGQLLRQGLDPYTHTASALRHHPLLNAVDPTWRHTIPPYGPLALRLEHLSAVFAGRGHEWLGLVFLRVLVLLCVLGVVLVLRHVTDTDLVTWLALSPLVLLQLIAALHLDAVLCLLVVLAVVLSSRGHAASAAVMAVAACEIKAIAAVVLLLVIVQGPWRRAAGYALAAAAAGLLLLPTDPFGWLAGLATPGRGWAPFTPSSSLYLVLHELDLPASRGVCAILFSVVGVVLLGAVLWSKEPLDRKTAWALLVVAVCGPVLWPWYLAAPALLMLLRTGSLRAPLLLGSLPALAALPLGVIHAQRVTAVAEVVALILLLSVRRPLRATVSVSR